MLVTIVDDDPSLAMVCDARVMLAYFTVKKLIMLIVN